MSEASEVRLQRSIESLEKTIQGLEDKLVRKDVHDRDLLRMEGQIVTLTKEVVRVEKDAGEDNARTEQSFKDLKTQMQANRNLLITAIASPILMLVIQVYLWSQGVK